MFCAPEIFLGVTEGGGARFQVLRFRTRFWRYQGRWGSFLCFAPRTLFGRYRGRLGSFSSFALPDTFSPVPSTSWLVFMFCTLGAFLTVPRASGLVFNFCAPQHIFGGIEGVGYRFQVLRSQTHFRRYQGHHGSFSSFALPYSFWLLLRASGPVFMFCAPELVSGGTEGAGTRFHVLRSRTRFRW
jgi:hypothetical protein